ncbi:hypothetical protein XU18_3640 [Perkinsela sp. CCAP 1560/4]|nr:hypothetical protein XU18_3640 [Perkinsela sp. CCAP 1560/4]|eukprot:KNH05321.1 hypothetical protein XU18_3640 [Perkinsela sp. CCAP 1560/4]
MQVIQHEYGKSLPQRLDLFKQLYADRFFFIDFDALLLSALNIASVDWKLVQPLHVIYHAELFLRRLRERRAKFSVILFKESEWMWHQRPSMRLLREMCRLHFRHHCREQNIDFMEFADMTPAAKGSFKQYYEEKQPEFMLLSDGEEVAPLAESADETQERGRVYLRARCVRFLRDYEFPVVFNSRVLFKDGTAVGFVWTNLKGESTPEAIATALSEIGKSIPKITPSVCTAKTYQEMNTRNRIFLRAADALKTTPVADGTLQMFFLHLAQIESCPLRERCFPLKAVSPSLHEFFEKICQHACDALCAEESYDTTIPDLFDERVFMMVCWETLEGKSMEAPVIAQCNSLCQHAAIAQLGDVSMAALKNTIDFVATAETDGEAPEDESIDEENPLELWTLREDLLKRIDDCYTAQENLTAKRENFFRRVHDDAQTLFEKPYDLTWKEKESRSVVKSSERGIMITNTYERVKQDVEKRKVRRVNLEQEFKAKEFHQGMATLTDFITDCQNAWKQFEREIRRIPDCTEVATVIFNSAVGYYELIMETYKFLIPEAEKIWIKEIDVSTARRVTPNPAAAATVFQLIHKARETIENNADFITTDQLKKKTKHYLRDLRDRLSILGLKDNVKVWEELWKKRGINLPAPSLFIPDVQNYYVKLSSARFQLSAMSERLDRPQSAGDRVEPSRVPFNPDKWQADLLDIVDNRESAIVCTPTSSGKTFVSFYCIKLTVSPNPACHKESAPGLVVYVSPTKPLLRQALASIYAKYQAKKYEMGWNVYGVLEDYAFMVEKCQALVTIPEAFEQLLLSSHVEDQNLVQRIQYVIFDEIHSIDDLRSGCIWERLLVLVRAPFVALSATISNAEVLAKWLQGVQDQAKAQHEARTGVAIPDKIELTDKNYAYSRRFKVHLIPKAGEKIHRWSDLAKYCFRPTEHYPNASGRTKVYDSNGMLDTEFHSDSVLPLNPLSLFTLKQLQDEGGFPKDMIFLPKEVIALYDIMKANCRKKATPEAFEKICTVLEPDEYFKSKNPLITQTDAREYEEMLLTEFMSWVSLAKTNKEYKRMCQGILSDSGSGINLMLPPLTTKLYNALSAAQEEDDDVLDYLYPDNFFQHEREPSVHSIRVHQYLLVGYLCQWEAERNKDKDSPFVGMVKEALDEFDVTSLERLPYPLSDYVQRIKGGGHLPESIDTFMEFCETARQHADVSDDSVALPRLDIPRPSSIEYAKEFLMELLTMLNTRDMLPAIAFTLDISDCEDMATRICDKLEANEAAYRHSDEFNQMVNEVEQLKKRIETQEKTRSGKTRQAKSGDSGLGDGDAKREKTDFRVDKDEFQEVEELIREIPPILPFFSFAKYGAGEDSAKVDELIAQSLGPSDWWTDFERKIVRCIQRGIGIHHKGLPNKIQALVEHLFRTQNLGVIVSTATLALGIHSPCRSVIIAGDSIELNPTQFRQMSGRAGRRGVDLLGHVFLLGVPFSKVKRLLTSKLQVLRGHGLTDPTNMLQMTNTVHKLKQKVQRDQTQRKKVTKKDPKEVIALLEEDVQRVFGNSLLENFFDNRRTFTREWVAHTQTLLCDMGLTLDDPSRADRDKLARISTAILLKSLSAYKNVRINPLNFSFLAAIRSGAMHEIARSSTSIPSKSGKFELSSVNTDFLIALCALTQLDDYGFPLELHRSASYLADQAKKQADTNSIALPALHTLRDGALHEALRGNAQNIINSYAALVRNIRAAAGETEETLPFSGIPFPMVGEGDDLMARCAFSALSGRTDKFDCIDEFVRCIPSHINLESQMLPAVDFIDHATHGHRHVLLNACTFDLLQFGAQKVHGKYKRIALRDLNGVSFDLSWGVLDQFRSMVFSLTAVGQALGPASSQIGPTDQHGNALRCVLHSEAIVGMAFKCHDCARRGVAVFLCEKCAFQTSFRCPNERIEIVQTSARGSHEFSPYVEDDFVATMEQICSLLENRKEMYNCNNFDAWQLSYARHKLQVRKDKLQCPLRCGTVNVSEMVDCLE